MTRRPAGARRHPRGLVAFLLGLTACLLAGDIAFVALSLAGPLGLAAAPGGNAAAIATAERFYAAVNAMLDNGDPAPLVALADPRYVEHPDDGDVEPPGPDGLVAAVLRLRALAPALRIAVISAAAASGDGDVTVRLRVSGVETARRTSRASACPPSLRERMSAWRVA